MSRSLIVQAGCLMTHAVRGVLMRGKGSRIERRQVAMPGILPHPVVLDPVPIGA